jgi:two-component system chemotaxis response regulator CheY
MDKVSPKLAQKKILIVDDQGSIRSVYKLVLQDMGFSNIDSATDGIDALGYLKTHPYDLVICDWNMPKMSGVEVLQILRDYDATETLPFMMVTSASELDKVREALGEGVSDYLIKPFQPSTFSLKVHDLLKGSTHVAAKLVYSAADKIEPANETMLEIEVKE